jgi:RNA polymerase sigma factor (sigma-70 family)
MLTVDMQDAELLREYVRNGSETAFAELVKRYVDLVYSSARRQLGDPQLAEEVAQNVFCLLARKARALGSERALAGWLYRATRFTAARARRSERRRRRREQEAAQMNAPDLKAEEVWGHLEPMLEQALDQLGEKDRLAVLLRFFQCKPMAEVGAVLSISEAAAKMRVSRSVERLRAFFAKRGVACSAAGLSTLLAERSVEAVPAATASNVTAAILSQGAGAASTLSIVQTLLFMARIKAGMLLAGGLVVVAVSVAVVRFHQSSEGARTGAMSAAGIVAGGGPETVQSANVRAAGPLIRPPAVIDLSKAIAALQAALHQRARDGYPSQEVFLAIFAFGPQRAEAFEVLKAAAAEPDREVRKLAISAMPMVGTPARPEGGLTGEPAPGVAAYLWDVLLGDDPELSHFALGGLRAVGLQPQTIPTLVNLLLRTHGGEMSLNDVQSAGDAQRLTDQSSGNQSLRRYIPAVIADLLQESPDATPYTAMIERLLDDPRPQVRFEAACALAKFQAASNPKIFEALTAGLQSKDNLMPLMALETLQTLGSGAAPMFQVVSNYANSAEDYTRVVAFKTLGKIDSTARSNLPEVDQALKKDENLAEWNERGRLGTRSYDYLVATLKDSMLAPSAAKCLGELGPSASDAVPDLLAALAGQNEGSRDRILEAIRQIDPSITISKVETRAIVYGAMAAKFTSRHKEGQPANVALARLLREAEVPGSSWWTVQELTNFVNQLAAQDPEICRELVSKAVAKDPALKSALSSVAFR